MLQVRVTSSEINNDSPSIALTGWRETHPVEMSVDHYCVRIPTNNDIGKSPNDSVNAAGSPPPRGRRLAVL